MTRPRRLIAATLALAASMTATAGVDVFVTFHTKGPDRYADGSPVLNGERYALVWSPDGVFDGVTAADGPVDPNDRVVIVAGVASGGRCPHVLYQLPAATAEALSGGVYDVVLFDTRVGGELSNSPDVVNGWTRTTAGVKMSGSYATAMDDDGTSHVASGAVAPPTDVEQPKIISMRVDGGYVMMQVDNLRGYMRVNGGPAIGSFGALTGATVADGGDEPVTLVVPKTGDSGFFRVIRSR